MPPYAPIKCALFDILFNLKFAAAPTKQIKAPAIVNNIVLAEIINGIVNAHIVRVNNIFSYFLAWL